MHCRPSNLDCMETALTSNCCSRWAKQCLIWNKCYAIDSDRAGAGSVWEKPSWEPSLGLEKSTPKLLALSALQGEHPWSQNLSVLSLKWRGGGGRGKLNFCEYMVVKLSSILSWVFWGMVYLCAYALFLRLGQNLPWRTDWLLLLLLCLAVASGATQDLFLSRSLSPREGRGCFMPRASWQNPLQQHLQSSLRIWEISSACFSFSSCYYLCNYVAESWFKKNQTKKRANQPWDDCLREFTLPDVNEWVDFSRPGITHIKTIDISKCMDICTWH